MPSLSYPENVSDTFLKKTTSLPWLTLSYTWHSKDRRLYMRLTTCFEDHPIQHPALDVQIFNASVYDRNLIPPLCGKCCFTSSSVVSGEPE